MEASHAPRLDWVARGWKAWLAVALVGVAAVTASDLHTRLTRQNDVLARLSYDLMHRWNAWHPMGEVVLVEITRESVASLEDPVHRNRFAEVLDRAWASGVELVFFDLVFDERRTEGGDDALAERLGRATNVVIGAAVRRKPTAAGWVRDARGGRVGFELLEITPPAEVFRRGNPVNWGLLDLEQDLDRSVRRLYGRFGDSKHPGFYTAAWRAATRVQAQPGDEGRERWLRYLGPAGKVFRHVGLAEVLQRTNALAGMRYVFVGVQPGGRAFEASGELSDLHPGPYRGPYHTGLEIQATAVMNLVKGSALSRWHPILQGIVTMIWAGLAVGLLTLRKRPWMVGVVVGLGIVLGWVAMRLAWVGGVWWPWLIPFGLQTLTAAGVVPWIPEPPLGRPVVFISYCATGTGELNACAIELGLRLNRIPAFLARGRVSGGDAYEEVFLPAIRDARHYLLVLTPSARSELLRPGSWVRKEFVHAVETGRRILVVRTRGGSSRFDREDLKEPAVFMRRLLESGNPVARDLCAGMPVGLVERMRGFTGGRAEGSVEVDDLIDDVCRHLRRVLEGGCFYEPARFAAVTLSEGTRDLLASPPAGPGGWVRLNRGLLRDAFPQEVYGVGEDVFPVALEQIPELPETVRRVGFHQVAFDPGDGFGESLRQILSGLKSHGRSNGSTSAHR